MKRVLTAAQMREADRCTIEDIGIPSIVLMETAGRQVVKALDETFADLADARVTVLAGRGNNGGDGFVVARTLAQRHVDVQVCLVGERRQVKGDARTNLDILDRLGIPVVPIRNEDTWAARRRDILDTDLVIDALFGTGLSSPLTGLHARVVGDLNHRDTPVVAIDLPSGLSADTPAPIGPHVLATVTVTLGALKYPLVLPPGEDVCGRLVVADIGIPGTVIDNLDGPRVYVMDPADVLGLLPERRPDSHKGTYGHVVVVAGSRGKTGAAVLAAAGALRSGAGLVTVATPVSVQATVAALGAEFMTLAVPDDGGVLAPGALETIVGAPADVIALGPGIGTGPGAEVVVRGVLDRATRPVVLDADALNVLGHVTTPLGRPGRPVILTPHPGEMARLCGLTTADVQQDRIGTARRTAEQLGVCVVLKGHRTVVAGPDGAVTINMTGNPGMATAGSGDVLAGMIAATVAQTGDAVSACRLAVHLHGAAGNLAARDSGMPAVTAGDIAARIGPAMLALVAEDDEERDEA